MRSVVIFLTLLASVFAGSEFEYFKNISLEHSKVSSILIQNALINLKESNDSSDTNLYANLNQYADNIFANLEHLMVELGLDPLKLPDLVVKCNKSIIFVVFYGDIKLSEGWLQDISTLHRSGDVILRFNKPTKIVELTCSIDFDDLAFYYDYEVKFMGFGPTGRIDGKITDAKLTVKLGFDFENFAASLNEFIIDNPGKVSLEFSGHELVDTVLNLFSEVVTAVIERLFILILEVLIRDSLDNAVNAINDFLHGFINNTSTISFISNSNTILNLL